MKVKEIREDREVKDLQEREGNFLSEWYRCGDNRKKPSRRGRLISCQSGVVVVHYKRTHPGIVQEVQPWVGYF